MMALLNWKSGEGSAPMCRGKRGLLVSPGALDVVLLPLDVARVLGAHLDLGAHLRRQALVQRTPAGRIALGVARRRSDRRPGNLQQRLVGHPRPAQQLEGAS